MRRFLLLLLLISSTTAVVEGVVPCDVADIAPSCYAALRPGPTRDVLQLVEVDGADTTESTGQLLLTTVSVESELTLGELWELRSDPTSERVDRSVYYPDDVDEDVTRQQFAAMMQDSVRVSTIAALTELGYELEPDGAEVIGVFPEGPSAELIEPGDVVTAADGAVVSSPDELAEAVQSKAPGDVVRLAVRTATDEEVVREITLGENPDDPSLGFVGLYLAVSVELPIEVDIDAGRIGGPSAGMMFALTLVDLLTPEDLTGGAVIAGTGEIGSDGRVGPIGGIEQKVAGATRRGEEPPATVFLVPRDNFADARTASVASAVTLVPIDTLGDAIAALEALLAGTSPTDSVLLEPTGTAAAG